MKNAIPAELSPLCSPGAEVFRVDRRKQRSPLWKVVDILTFGSMGDAAQAQHLGQSWYLVAAGSKGIAARVEKGQLAETLNLDDYTSGSARPLRKYVSDGYSYRVVAKVGTA